MDIKYEAPPPGLTVGIGIHKLRKVFGTNVVAIDRVDLDIYQNQITVLLGHNGAGKSTMLSILTGNIFLFVFSLFTHCLYRVTILRCGKTVFFCG